MTDPDDHIRQSMQDAMIAVNDLDDLYAAAHRCAGLSEALRIIEDGGTTCPPAPT